MSESRETRLKRLRMRSMRRGIKEMDLILSAYAEARLDAMTGPTLDLYDALLEQNDQDLFQWVTRRAPAPEPFLDLIEDISQVIERQ